MLTAGHAVSEPASLDIGVHWLSATIPQDSKVDLDLVLSFITAELKGADWEVYDRGVSGYTRTYRTLFGLRVLVNDSRPDMGIHVIVDGEACEAIGFSSLTMLYHGLQMRASRIDLAVDGCPFEPVELMSAWVDDNVRTACKPERRPLPGREGIRKCHWHSSPSGDTFYMGSRTSTVFARCYNERGATRFELELKKERAAAVAARVFAEHALAGITLGLIRSFADFVDATSDTNRSRCQLLPFWEEFVAHFEAVKVRIDPRPETTQAGVIRWIESQVASMLVVYQELKVREGRGSKADVSASLHELGVTRMTARHLALVAYSPRATPRRAEPHPGSEGRDSRDGSTLGPSSYQDRVESRRQLEAATFAVVRA